MKLQTGEVVPEQYYDLDPQSQQRMLELIRERETKEKDDNAALNAVQQLLDLRDRDSARLKALEGQLGLAVSVIEALQKRLDSIDLQLQADKLTALLEQEAVIAAAVTNLSAIRAEAGQEAAISACASAKAVCRRSSSVRNDICFFSNNSFSSVNRAFLRASRSLL